LSDLTTDMAIILKWIVSRVWTGFGWLRLESSNWLLWAW